VEKLVNNRKTAYSLLYRLIQNGLVKKIRSNLYTCVNVETDQPIASKYQIASAISKGSYISHHTAFEYYGLANQVFYEVYVSSDTRFNDFEFDGVAYKYIASKLSEGVVTPKNTTGIRITNIERTVIDSVKDFYKIGGLEELLSCLDMLTFLDSDKLARYLDAYGMKILYQKTGYILDHYRDSLKLPESFIEYCKSKIGRSTRYLSVNLSNDGSYNKEWQLVIPHDLFYKNEQVGAHLV
jgi:predicted transcriptional regulator of viral defense system